MTTRYVLGFAFSTRAEFVLLLLKNRPDWQRGKLNGVGGKIEEGESPRAAMAREFEEETGIETPLIIWHNFASFSGDDHEIECFSTVFNHEALEQAEGEETPMLVGIHHLHQMAVIPNLRWLIPMALSFDLGERCQQFIVKERM